MTVAKTGPKILLAMYHPAMHVITFSPAPMGIILETSRPSLALQTG